MSDKPKTLGGEEPIIHEVDVLPETGTPGEWYYWAGRYYWYNTASGEWVKTGGDRPHTAPPNP